LLRVRSARPGRLFLVAVVFFFLDESVFFTPCLIGRFFFPAAAGFFFASVFFSATSDSLAGAFFFAFGDFLLSERTDLLRERLSIGRSELFVSCLRPRLR